ncbi:MAG: hypothetical protein AAGI01_11670 [Myxococcota bacterium]
MSRTSLRHRNYAVALVAAVFCVICVVYCWYGPVVLDLEEVPLIMSCVGAVALVISGAASGLYYSNRTRWFTQASPWWHAVLGASAIASAGATLGFGVAEWFYTQLGLGSRALSWALFLSVPGICVFAHGMWITRASRALRQ